MSKHKSKTRKHFDSVEYAVNHIKEYEPEMRKIIKKAVKTRETIKKDYPKQMVQLV